MKVNKKSNLATPSSSLCESEINRLLQNFKSVNKNVNVYKKNSVDLMTLKKLSVDQNTINTDRQISVNDDLQNMFDSNKSNKVAVGKKDAKPTSAKVVFHKKSNSMLKQVNNFLKGPTEIKKFELDFLTSPSSSDKKKEHKNVGNKLPDIEEVFDVNYLAGEDLNFNDFSTVGIENMLINRNSVMDNSKLCTPQFNQINHSNILTDDQKSEASSQCKDII